MLFINVYGSASGNTHLERKACAVLKLWSFILLNSLTCDGDVRSHSV